MKIEDRLDGTNRAAADLRRLVEKSSGAVLQGGARAYAFTPQDQEDLFQEITTQVWRSIPGFLGDAAVTTWIYRVALNVAIAWTQKEGRHRAGKQGLDGVQPAILQA